MLSSWRLHGLSGETLLWLAGLTTLVLIGLFLLRPRPRRLDVSSDLLWRRALPKRRNPLVRDVLLLLLQLLLLWTLLGALAEPRPLVPEAKVFPGSDRVWIVDRSLSMSAEDEEGLSR
ncbi:MAG: BatA domain-containing protein, partial [Myxococcota bacterium]|nr:BatA domain-containing protein [Myxococcota bacterium]